MLPGYTDNEIPNFVIKGSILGMSMMGISLIIYTVFMVLYNEAYDTRATLTRVNMSKTESALMISYIVTGVIGYLLCFLIPYGHYLKSFNDPSIISSKNGLHFETVNPELNYIKAVDVVKPKNVYALAGSEGSNLVSSGTSKFRGTRSEKFL
jgi:hypothetical protein